MMCYAYLRRRSIALTKLRQETFKSRFMIVVIVLGLLGVMLLVFALLGHWAFALLGIPILLLCAIGLYEYFQPSHSITRNFPLIGRSRYVAEWLRPKLFQYFIESDIDGKPFSRIFRSIVYQRAKDAVDTAPFGTQLDVYGEGYEWMEHSIAALDHHMIEDNPRIIVGGPDCLQPYECSIYNVSAMSYGSLSKNAVMALNGGAALGGFAQNTGEGGISPYHDKHGGDLIYQLGTGYFGSRTEDGNFSPELFKQRCVDHNVKMIELKLSQGAKPGHGGILPAKKVTEEIAEIRNVPIGQDVLSPPYHKAFSTPIELLNFIKTMRDLSGGKPVGFKLCIGKKSEFLAICKAMVKTGIKPDFISIDGGEGGTGAAPLEFSNSVGMPFREGLAFAFDALTGFDLKKDIKLLASGKIVTGFHIYRALSIGADICYSARAMMMALGCIQALECNKNTCPVGVATNDPHLMRGLVVEDKKKRVAQFHKETLKSFVELQAASGFKNMKQINRSSVYRRIDSENAKRYDQIYPYIPKGCLLDQESVPEKWQYLWSVATAESFAPRFEEVFEN